MPNSVWKQKVPLEVEGWRFGGKVEKERSVRMLGTVLLVEVAETDKQNLLYRESALIYFIWWEEKQKSIDRVSK